MLRQNIRDFTPAVKKVFARSQFVFVYQKNDLATALGRLSILEQKIFDYCTSFIEKSDDGKDVYVVSVFDMMKGLKLRNSGNNKVRVINAYIKLIKQSFMAWNVEENIFSPFNIFNFSHSGIDPKNEIMKFQFSKKIQPYLFFLKNRYYAYPRLVVNSLSSKYSVIALRLISAADSESEKIVKLSGSIDEWESWMGLKDPNEMNKYTASEFNRSVIKVFLAELNKKFTHYHFSVKSIKQGRRVSGYKLIMEKDSYVMNLKNPMSDEALAIQNNGNVHKFKRGTVN